MSEKITKAIEQMVALMQPPPALEITALQSVPKLDKWSAASEDYRWQTARTLLDRVEDKITVMRRKLWDEFEHGSPPGDMQIEISRSFHSAEAIVHYTQERMVLLQRMDELYDELKEENAGKGNNISAILVNLNLYLLEREAE